MLTSTIYTQLAEQYADMLAQNFRARKVLLSSYHHTFSDLLRFDNRIYAFLDGVTHLKKEVAQYFSAQLESIFSPADLFSVALFAAYANDKFLLSGCLGLVQAMPHLLPALCSAIDWMPAKSSLWPLIVSLPSCRAYMATMRLDKALAADAFTQKDIMGLIEQGSHVDYLLNFLHKSTSPLFIPAMETVFSSNQENLILQGCRALSHAALISERLNSTAAQHLVSLSQSNNIAVRTSAIKYLLTRYKKHSNNLIADLETQNTDTRLLIKAKGWSGLTKFIPSLIDFFDIPEYARLSTLSVISITGSIPEQDNWQGKKREYSSPQIAPDSRDIPEQDQEHGICWPDKSGFERWWQASRENFTPARSYLFGQPTTPAGLSKVLDKGYLYLRPLALTWMGQFTELSTLPATHQTKRLIQMKEQLCTRHH